MNNQSSLSFITSAVFVSYILIDQLTTDQQGLVGGWFTVVGDILSASSTWNSTMQSAIDNDDKNDTSDNNDDNMETLRQSIEKIEEILKKNHLEQ